MGLFVRIANRSRSRSPSQATSEAEEDSIHPDVQDVEERCGLFLLHEPSAHNGPTIDIVAVHGLGGHWRHTWTSPTSKLWLRDFLPAQLGDAGINARVLSYGYNSDTAFSHAITNIDDEAAILLDRLQGERETTEEKSRPILFISHSLGGIVVKKAIVIAHERTHYYAGLLAHVQSTVFLAVPHRGSDVAYWGSFAARLLQVGQFGFGTNTAYVKALQRNSESFTNISTQFVERCASLTVRTFFETEKMGNVLVVDRDSARLGVPNEIATGIAGSTHSTICKFDKIDSQKYKPVWQAIRSLAQSAIATQYDWGTPILAPNHMASPFRKVLVNAGAEQTERPKPATHASTPASTSRAGDWRMGEEFVAAAAKSDLEAVTLSLRNGVNVNSIDAAHGKSALHWAAEHGFVDLLDVLIDAGARMNMQDHYGETAMHYAANGGHTEAVRVLLEGGANPQVLNHRRMTSLRCARDECHTETVRVLLPSWSPAWHPKETWIDKQGRSALHWAALLEMDNVVEKAVSAADHDLALDASIWEHDHCGSTPLDYARDAQDDRLLKMLKMLDVSSHDT